MTTREKILGRIREGLTLPAPRPGAHGTKDTAATTDAHAIPTSESFAEWLPLVGTNLEQWTTLFARNAEALKADFRLLPEGGLEKALQALSIEEGWNRIATHRGPWLSAVKALNLPCLETDSGYSAVEMEQCSVGISGCDALIAQTGTVLLSAKSGGGRALSVLPPHHVVIARKEQMVPDLPEAFALLKARYASNYPSLITFITGPSRTGDIERILVLGAHGPKKLTILMH